MPKLAIDGIVYMSCYERHCMYTLSSEERQTLIAMIREVHGLELDCYAFADEMLGLFEDISGLETMPPAETICIVNELWNLYHGQEARKD